ncbi:MAG: hypothetical protein HYY06_11415 [Deltaproteobacteria bacterium]|nr:hypothetical protein [Deltaproteobacteria bacterium]
MRGLRKVVLAVTFVAVAAVAFLADGSFPSLGGEDSRGAAFAQSRNTDPCRNAAANTSVTLGPGQPRVTSVSPDTAYSTAGCGKWVVDISVGQLASIKGQVPPLHGTDVYRVSVSASNGGAFKRVEARAQREVAH